MDWDATGIAKDGSYLKIYDKFSIGRICSCDGQQYYGLIDDMSVFDYVLTDDEVNQVYMSGK